MWVCTFRSPYLSFLGEFHPKRTRCLVYSITTDVSGLCARCNIIITICIISSYTFYLPNIGRRVDTSSSIDIIYRWPPSKYVLYIIIYRCTFFMFTPFAKFTCQNYTIHTHTHTHTHTVCLLYYILYYIMHTRYNIIV